MTEPSPMPIAYAHRMQRAQWGYHVAGWAMLVVAAGVLVALAASDPCGLGVDGVLTKAVAQALESAPVLG